MVNSRLNALTVAGWVVVVLFAVIGLYLRLNGPDFAGQWVLRDIDRAIAFFNGSVIGLAGSEMNFGGQLPGPWGNAIMALPLLIFDQFEAVKYWNIVLNVVAVLIVTVTCWRVIGKVAAFASGIFLAVCPPMIWAAHWSFNPAWILIFQAAVIYCLLVGSRNRQSGYFVAAIILISVGICAHMTLMTWLIPTICLWIIFGGVSVRNFLAIVFAWLLIYAPFMVYLAHGYNLPTNVIDGIRLYKAHAPDLISSGTAVVLFVALAFWLRRQVREGVETNAKLRTGLLVAFAIALIFYGLPGGFSPTPIPYRQLFEIMILGTTVDWFYVQGVESALMTGLASIEAVVSKSIAPHLLTFFLVVVVPLLPTSLIFDKTRRIGAIIVSFMLFTPFVAMALYLNGRIDSPHHWYYLHLAFPTALFIGCVAAAVYDRITALSLSPAWTLRTRAGAVAVLVLPVAWIGYITADRVLLVRDYYPSGEGNPREYYSRNASITHSFVEGLARMVYEEANLSLSDFLSRTRLLSRTDNGLNHILYAYVRDSRFNGVGETVTDRPALYSDEKPCLFIEIKERAHGPIADLIRARMFAVIDVLRTKETANLLIHEYRPSGFDYCLTNTRLDWSVTRDTLEVRNAINNGAEITVLPIPKPAGSTQAAKGISSRYAIFDSKMHTPYLVDLNFRQDGPDHMTLEMFVHSEMIDGRNSLSWGGNPGRQFKNIEVVVRTASGATSERLIENDAVGDMLFKPDRADIPFWPGYSPFGLHRSIDGRIDRLENVAVRFQYHGENASTLTSEFDLPITEHKNDSQ